jgi:hypothetical protein
VQCATHSQRVATLGTYGAKKFSECKLFLYVRKTFQFSARTVNTNPKLVNWRPRLMRRGR